VITVLIDSGLCALYVEPITQLSAVDCLPGYGRSTTHIAPVAAAGYNDSGPTSYKDISRYYYYYQQCSPDVIAAHQLHQHPHPHHHHHHHQQHQAVLPAGAGLVYHHATAAENGGGSEAGQVPADVSVGVAGRVDGTGAGYQPAGGVTSSSAVSVGGPGPATVRYYSKSPVTVTLGPAASQLTVDHCRPVTAPLTANWTHIDHQGTGHRHASLVNC